MNTHTKHKAINDEVPKLLSEVVNVEEHNLDEVLCPFLSFLLLSVG